jgi:hypothetical protein
VQEHHGGSLRIADAIGDNANPTDAVGTERLGRRHHIDKLSTDVR